MLRCGLNLTCVFKFVKFYHTTNQETILLLNYKSFMDDATQRHANVLLLFQKPLYLPHSTQNLPLTTVTPFMDDTLPNQDLSNLAS